MTKHTPGPWRTSGTQSFYVFAGDEVVTNGSTQANARLIAAAPDLLAALESLFEHCAMVHKQWGDGDNTRQADAAINAARAAIAKATGGSVE